jgi:CubicO group peptidase (beta-lactamase class C family)
MPELLEQADPQSLGLRRDRLEALCALVEGHIAEGRYPGAQLAVARHGKLALARTFGHSHLQPQPRKATSETLWRIYSSTKVLVAAGIWLLVEDGLLSFQDTVAMHLPGFEKNGKGDITLLQLLTHQGGFPAALDPIDPAAWEDRELLRRLACDIELEWEPGTRVQYHRRSAHWVAALVIEQLGGMDFRQFLGRRLLEPAGLANDIFIGIGEREYDRTADTHRPAPDGRSHARNEMENTPAFRAACEPGSGATATAVGMAAFYQLLIHGGRAANGRQLLSPRTIAYATRNFTGDRVDSHMKMAMHRGLGPHTRGHSESIRGMGSLAHPSTFGHGGVGTSYCWGDPDSGVSFAFLSNSQLPDPWHSRRLDVICNCVHSAIGDL